jgi:hypothetical protein
VAPESVSGEAFARLEADDLHVLAVEAGPSPEQAVTEAVGTADLEGEGLIIIPLAAAALTQALARRAVLGRVVMGVMQALMIPSMMATLAVVVGSQIVGVGQELGSRPSRPASMSRLPAPLFSAARPAIPWSCFLWPWRCPGLWPLPHWLWCERAHNRGNRGPLRRCVRRQRLQRHHLGHHGEGHRGDDRMAEPAPGPGAVSNSRCES